MAGVLDRICNILSLSFMAVAAQRPWGNFRVRYMQIGAIECIKTDTYFPSLPFQLPCLPFGPKWGHLKKPECKYRFDSYDQEERGALNVFAFLRVGDGRGGESPVR